MKDKFIARKNPQAPGKLYTAIIISLMLLAVVFQPSCKDLSPLEQGFLNPPDSARPGVYWYFMDGNLSKEAMTKDLEAMKKTGIGNVVYLEVNNSVPRGTIDFLSDKWMDMFGHAVAECERLGINITLGVGPGWTGSGGPWVEASQSMQHLVTSSVEVSGAGRQTVTLPKPAPKRPFFGEGTFTPEVKIQWDDFYEDVAVLAFPSGTAMMGAEFDTGKDYFPVTGIEEKALYYRKPFSSTPHVKQYLTFSETRPGEQAVDKDKIIDLTASLQPDGTLTWDVPAGRWTVMRFGSRNNGAVTRPAPLPGVGLEADKMDTIALNAHIDRFLGKLFRHIGFKEALPQGGLQMLHMDSWEMGAQNWTARFREEFTRRRGYNPQPFYPVYAGVIVQSREESERFLWDVRQTLQELVMDNHAGHIKRYAKRYGLGLSIEPYDMNPTADLELASTADMPMCEFWSIDYGFPSSFSVMEGTSAAHLIGQPVVPAESFTSFADGWRQYPGSMKNQTDWAFASGINRLVFHTFQHQYLDDRLRPGMTMGPHGVHWDRNQTWWPMADAYHRYVSRCQFLLQQGRTVADILYLTPEGAPHVFLAPRSALEGELLDAGKGLNFREDETPLPDRKGYNFDGCPPSLLYRATVKDGRVVFPGGATYRLLVLPCFETMTPSLLKKIRDLVNDGATVVGTPPQKSPSLNNYPACDTEVRKLVQELWGGFDIPETTEIRAFGKGKVIWSKKLRDEADNLYPAYNFTADMLASTGIPADFESPGQIRYTHRTMDGCDIYFVSNRTDRPVTTECKFRATNGRPELWNPMTGEMFLLPEYTVSGSHTAVPLQFDVHQGYFVVFRAETSLTETSAKKNFPEKQQIATLSAPWTVSFDPLWGGPEKVVFEQLTDWSQHTDQGIKYYSGTAVYRQTFDLPVQKNARMYLDLGKVKNMARVRLNGHDLGVVWTAPWRVDITKAVKNRDNRLEIEVVNLWPNRLIGDEQLPDDGIRDGEWPDWLKEGKPRTGGRYTFTTYQHYTKDSPLLESGLTGPVTVWSTQISSPEDKDALRPGATGTADKDAFRPGAAGTVRLDGWLGKRMNRSYENQIMALDIELFLKVYRDHSDNDNFRGEYWGKWFTAASLAWQNRPTEELKQKLRYAADEIIKSKAHDGYIGSYTEDKHITGIWDIWNRKYAILGLVTDYDLTGNEASLTAASDAVYCLMRELKDHNHKLTDNGVDVLQGVASMSMLEPVALVAQRTGKPELRAFAETLVTQWSEPNRFLPEGHRLIEDALAGKAPMKSHSYALMSCFEGVCEMYRLTGEHRYREAAIQFAQSLRKYELMVNGSMSNQELFCEGKFSQTEILNQPQETCVTVTWMKLCYRLLRLTGDPLWADEMEISLYNALLGAMTPNGGWWAYHSPLTGERLASQVQQDDTGVSCCMMNAPRGLFLTSRWAVMASDDGPVVNLYSPGSATITLNTGNSVKIVQNTEYPFESDVRLIVSPEQEERFSLRLRIPSWSKSTKTVQVNGEDYPANAGTYLTINRTWKQGDTVTLALDMNGRVIPAPGSKTQFALMSGPILLAIDNRFVRPGDDALWMLKEDGNIDLHKVTPTPEGVNVAFTVPFEIRPFHFFNHSQTELIFCDYASAGNLWSESNLFRTWIPQPLYLPHAFVPGTWKLLNANHSYRATIPKGK